MTPNPSSLLLLADKLQRLGRGADPRHPQGRRNPAYVPDGAPTGLTAGLTRRIRRAPTSSQAILKRDGALIADRRSGRTCGCVSCWKGGTMPLYLRKLPAVFGDVPVRDLGYMASEGRGATPLVNSGAAGVLNVTSHFFEFVPEEQRDDPNQTFLTARRSSSRTASTTSTSRPRPASTATTSTTSSGSSTSTANTPVIQFVRKGQGMTSITGEKLTESQVTGALLDVVESGGYDVAALHGLRRVGRAAALCALRGARATR